MRTPRGTIFFPVLLAAVLCTLMSQHASAQRSGNQGDGPRFSWSGGGEGNGLPTEYGLSIAGAYGHISPGVSSSLDKEWNSGFRGGLFMAVPVNKYLSIRPEANYATLRTGNKTAGFEFSAAYMELPLLCSFDLKAA